MGVDKPLLRFRSGKRLLEDQIERLTKAGLEEIFVVIGCHANLIKSEFAGLNVKWFENRSWELGSFSSLQTGIKNIPSLEDGVLILPIDAAGISPTTIDDIVSNGIKTKKSDIPLFNKQRGHPVYLNKKICMAILEAKPDGRLDLILEDEKELLLLPTNDANILQNINTMNEWDLFLSFR